MKKLLLSIMVAVWATSPVQAAEELTYQSFWAPSHPLNREFVEPWCAGFAPATNGEIIMHYTPLNAQVKAESVSTAIRSGSLEAGGIQLQHAVSLLPLSQMVALPFLVQNADEATTMARTLYETFPEVRAEVDKNYKYVSFVGTDRFAFVANKELIKSPADLVGKRVLIWAPYLIDEVKAWGGVPVQVATTETYMGLQRGLGEVAYVPVPAVEAQKLSEVAKFVTVIPSRTMPMLIAINKEVWESLPPEAQEYVNSTGPELANNLGKGLLRITANDMDKMQEHGCTIYELNVEEQTIFKEAAAEVNYEYWINLLKRNNIKNPEEWIAKVETLAQETLAR